MYLYQAIVFLTTLHLLQRLCDNEWKLGVLIRKGGSRNASKKVTVRRYTGTVAAAVLPPGHGNGSLLELLERLRADLMREVR
jgi:hypothetical protein